MKNTVLLLSALFAASVLAQNNTNGTNATNYTGNCAGCFAAGYTYNQNQSCTNGSDFYSLNSVYYCDSTSYSNYTGSYIFNIDNDALTATCTQCASSNQSNGYSYLMTLSPYQEVNFDLSYENTDDSTQNMTF